MQDLKKIKENALKEAKKQNLNEEQTNLYVEETLKKAEEENKKEEFEKKEAEAKAKAELEEKKKQEAVNAMATVAKNVNVNTDEIKEKIYTVKAKVENFNGEVAGVQFAYGKAEVKPGWVLEWFKEKGYEITEAE